jgi:hypothetical protein
MRKIIPLVFLAFSLSGCAAYRFNHGKPPHDKGYLASRDGYVILEYTVGKDNSVPEDLKFAKERFKRRRHTVERYYKKMGYIENRFKEWFYDPAAYFVKFIVGVFRIPAIAVSDYRYRHNPKYKERVLRKEEERDLKEETIIKKLRASLDAYIQEDLKKEGMGPGEITTPQPPADQLPQPVQPAAPEVVSEIKTEAPAAKLAAKVKVAKKKQRRPATAKPKKNIPKQEEKAPQEPVALIMAKPVKGYSPLVVHFYGRRSYSPGGRITSYSWDFGDGDTSTKKNAVNVYVSTAFQPQKFTVTLTVTDNKGSSASAQQVIEVLNK